MKYQLLAILICAAAPDTTLADASTGSRLDGTWKFEYSCEGATGIYADRCAAGERDYFTLAIVKDGGRYCGWYDMTFQMGNHDDAGDLSDWTFTPMPDQAFYVHYHLYGTVGEASIRVAGNELRWNLLDRKPDGEDVLWTSVAPQIATLIKQSPDKVRHAPHC
jgi:hypothetical protein